MTHPLIDATQKLAKAQAKVLQQAGLWCDKGSPGSYEKLERAVYQMRVARREYEAQKKRAIPE